MSWFIPAYRFKDYAIGVLQQDPKLSNYTMSDEEMCVREEDGAWNGWKEFPCKKTGRYVLLLFYCCEHLNFFEMDVYAIVP